MIPGHGSPFTDVALALGVARKRLQGFMDQPEKHRLYAAKVLLKFKLLEAQAMEREALQAWALATRYFASLLVPLGVHRNADAAVDVLVQDLVRSGAATVRGTRIYNA